MVVPVRADLVAQAESLAARLIGAVLRGVQRLRADLRGLVRSLPAADTVLAQSRQRLDAVSERLPRALRANAHSHRVAYERIVGRHGPRALRTQIANSRERIGGLDGRARRGLRLFVERKRARAAARFGLLNALGYRQVLQRGYALVRDAAGEPVRSAAAVAAGDRLDIEFSDGRLGATADGGEGPLRRVKRGRGGQGSLFD
jgi:exodeoxyribonuclease VII large subunit